MMQSGKLNYVYRLSAARLAILRLRFKRRGGFSTGKRAISLAGLLVCALSAAGWLGYSLAKPAEWVVAPGVEPAVANAVAPVPVTATVVRPADPIEVPDVSERANVALLQQTANKELQQTIHELEAHIETLEQETTSLESELLDQQLTFARERARWKESTIERRVIYNITNIPVGGSVSEERMDTSTQTDQGAVGYQGQPVTDGADPNDKYRLDDGAQGQWDGEAYLADVLEQQAESGEEAVQEPEPGSFGGPAPDRYEDLINH